MPEDQIKCIASKYSGCYEWNGYSDLLDEIADVVFRNNLSKSKTIQAIKDGLMNSNALFNDVYCKNLAVAAWKNIQRRK